jgi:fibro-slime domain-containing protein
VPSRSLVIGSLLSLGFALLGGCGARSELSASDVVCSVEGAARPCSDDCGSGSQTCSAGLWSECAVPVVTRTCSDGCASGEERCEAGAWRACIVPLVQRECRSVCGAGQETCRAGVWGACDAPQPRPPQLAATIRDFSEEHPDFEASYPPGLERGIVMSDLGPDDKPVYNGSPRTRTTTGKAEFDQWFRDSPVNRSKPLELSLLPSTTVPGLFEYSDDEFFPINGELLGNETRMRNYHFTLEASTRFEYRGGEVFSFSGDDDMWVFVNRRLAIDLGGLHEREEDEIELDSYATYLGLELNEVYPLHFFFAERHTNASRFQIRTTIAEPGACD